MKKKLSRSKYWAAVRNEVERMTGKTFLHTYIRDVAHGIKESPELAETIRTARAEVLKKIKSSGTPIKEHGECEL